MGIFEHFPYTNFHNLNLDRILERTEVAEEAVQASAQQVQDAAADMAAAQAAAANAVSVANNAANAANNAVNTANSASTTANSAINTANDASATASNAAASASAAESAAIAAKNAAEALSAASMIIYEFDVSREGTISSRVTPTVAWIRQLVSDVSSGNALLRFYGPNVSSTGIEAFSSIPSFITPNNESITCEGTYTIMMSNAIRRWAYSFTAEIVNNAPTFNGRAILS